MMYDRHSSSFFQTLRLFDVLNESIQPPIGVYFKIGVVRGENARSDFLDTEPNT